jgi:hypothetical protein
MSVADIVIRVFSVRGGLALLAAEMTVTAADQINKIFKYYY